MRSAEDARSSLGAPADLLVEASRPGVAPGSRRPAPRRPSQRPSQRSSQRSSQGTVVLVGCSAAKLGHAAPARELYTSQLFRMSRDYALARGCEWAILSALHGLVLPDEVLEPYDVSVIRLRSSSSGALRDWEAKVALRLDEVFPGARFVLVAGGDYRGALAHLPASRREEPLRGLGIGDRQGWLKRQTAHLNACRRPSS